MLTCPIVNPGPVTVSDTVSIRTAETSAQPALDKVLASTTFSQVERLKRFLEFIANETLAGRGGQLKEYLVGTEVFGKPPTFDPRNDPIVRVQARRLRAKLAAYYASEGREDAVWLDLPKGSYVPVFHRQGKTLGAKPVIGLPANENSIAVLPFTDQSQAGDQAYLCHGLSEEIISSLIRVESLRVVPWTRPRESGMVGVLEAAEELGVGTIVNGSIRKFGDRLRINVHLVDAARNHYLWTHTFDRDCSDILALQEEIAATLVDSLQGHLGDARVAASRSTGNLAAYSLYLKGRYHCNQRSEKALLKAAECFAQAIAEDPKYALAHAGLADANALLANYGYVSPLEAWPKAVSAAKTSVLIDPGVAETHTALAHVLATHDWDRHDAESEFRRAIEVNPRYAPAHHWFGITTLASSARLDEGIAEIETAMALDPTSPVLSRDLAVLYYYKRDMRTALDQGLQTAEQDPHFYGAYWIVGLVHEYNGDFGQAIACLERANQLTPNNPRMMGALGRTLALAGKPDEAAAILKGLDALALERYVSPLDPALVHFALGELQEGFERLNQMQRYRCFDLIHLKVDPRFDALRADPRFTHFLEKAGLVPSA
jgi:TolB-like protein/Tfp pilus assembly protein PilF